MVVLVEPPGVDGSRISCDPGSALESSAGAPLGDAEDRDCRANLTLESGPAGRRKLVVTLPDSGELAVIDAQGILDAPPGSFDDCSIELRVPLRVEFDPAGAVQTPPPDLERPKGCTPSTPLPGPASPSYVPRPGGLAFGGTDFTSPIRGRPSFTCSMRRCPVPSRSYRRSCPCPSTIPRAWSRPRASR